VRRIVRLVATIGLVLVAGAVLTYTLPPLVLRDEQAPTRIAPLVEDARSTIVGNSRRFPLPLHPRLIDVRCFTDGFVALYFEEWVPPYLDVTYGVAVGQVDPPSGPHAWEGGYHLDSISPGSAIELELSTQLGAAAVCD